MIVVGRYQFEAVINKPPVGLLFLYLELHRVLTILREQLTYTAGVVAVQLVIVCETEQLGDVTF